MLVTFLPSSNGLGHVNRCILLAVKFIKEGWDCNIWCLQSNLNKLSLTIPEIENIKRINCMNLSMPSINDFMRRTSLSNSFLIEAREKLKNSDLIISDNHLESLLISRKVILSANFFWHQNYISDPKKDHYQKYISDLIKKYNPNIISSKIFQDRIENCFINNYFIGLIVNSNSLVFEKNKEFKKDSILVSAGMTENSIFEALRITQKLVDNEIHLKKGIFIEPRLTKYKSWPNEIEEANYTQEMYKSLICAFIRPGLGTLVNCLSNYVCPIYFSETNNLEMKNNKMVIEKNKIGFEYNENLIQFSEIKTIESKVNNILSNIKLLDFNGTNQFYDTSVNIYN